MANQSIRQVAQNFQPKTVKNITELKSIDIDLLTTMEKGVDQEGIEYDYTCIEVNGEKYRVPDSVLGQLKQILQKKPSMKNYAVTKTGEGRLTRYQVIPLD